MTTLAEKYENPKASVVSVFAEADSQLDVIRDQIVRLHTRANERMGELDAIRQRLDWCEAELGKSAEDGVPSLLVTRIEMLEQQVRTPLDDGGMDSRLGCLEQRVTRLYDLYEPTDTKISEIHEILRYLSDRISALEPGPTTIAIPPTVAVPVETLREADRLLHILAAWSDHDNDTQAQARATYHKISALLVAGAAEG